MSHFPMFGLALSLFGVPLLLVGARQLRLNPLSLAVRLGFWILGFGVLVLTIFGAASWSQQLGFIGFSAKTLGAATVAILATLVAWPLLQHTQKWLGGVSVEQTPQFHAIAALSYGYRIFLVATAATVEEVLYRGYAIGVGQYLLGGLWPAATVSILVFTLSHFRWGLSHLLSVLWAALVLTLLFLQTGDLLACMLAHAAIDAVGLLLAPAAMARSRRRAGVERDAG
jgi:membrane protease YdiL (CAAX protease family)